MTLSTAGVGFVDFTSTPTYFAMQHRERPTSNQSGPAGERVL